MRHATAKFGSLVHRFNMISVGLHAREFFEIVFWSFLDPTTWGKWDPATVNGDRAFSDGRGLNSAQILAWLRAAARLAGNATYDAAADDLKAAHG